MGHTPEELILETCPQAVLDTFLEIWLHGTLDHFKTYLTPIIYGFGYTQDQWGGPDQRLKFSTFSCFDPYSPKVRNVKFGGFVLWDCIL